MHAMAKPEGKKKELLTAPREGAMVPGRSTL